MCPPSGTVYEKLTPTRDLSGLAEDAAKNTAAVDEELFVRPKWRYRCAQTTLATTVARTLPAPAPHPSQTLTHTLMHLLPTATGSIPLQPLPAQPYALEGLLQLCLFFVRWCCIHSCPQVFSVTLGWCLSTLRRGGTHTHTPDTPSPCVVAFPSALASSYLAPPTAPLFLHASLSLVPMLRPLYLSHLRPVPLCPTLVPSPPARGQRVHPPIHQRRLRVCSGAVLEGSGA
jgi:hypothetical protein